MSGEGGESPPAVRRLQAQHLAKSYRKRRAVVDVSVEVAGGEIVGLLGPNGAGKTTCFYMIAGLVAPDKGRVCVDGCDITALPISARARAGIGYLPQEASVFRKLTVADNILAILEINRALNRVQRQAMLQALLEEFQLTAIAETPGVALSGGERRRVEIARALASQPAFILLDEPFAGVDPISVIDIKSIITHLKERGIGVLITDHNVRETLDICERAYIVSGGQIIAEGDTQAILDHQQVRKVYLGDAFTV